MLALHGMIARYDFKYGLHLFMSTQVHVTTVKSDLLNVPFHRPVQLKLNAVTHEKYLPGITRYGVKMLLVIVCRLDQ